MSLRLTKVTEIHFPVVPFRLFFLIVVFILFLIFVIFAVFIVFAVLYRFYSLVYDPPMIRTPPVCSSVFVLTVYSYSPSGIPARDRL